MTILQEIGADARAGMAQVANSEVGAATEAGVASAASGASTPALFFLDETLHTGCWKLDLHVIPN
jgi:hypothetical protein